MTSAAPDSVALPESNQGETTQPSNPWLDSQTPQVTSQPVGLVPDDEEHHQAQNAWAASDSHPPPSQSPSPPPKPSQSPPPTPPGKDNGAPLENTPPQTPSKDERSSSDSLSNSTAPSLVSALPSLSNLARSFTIPTLTRSRPLSMDGANASALPALPDSPSPEQSSNPPEAQQNALALNATQDITTSNTPEASTNVAEEPPFDFQKFLKQMNTRSAEPVSRYLKSFLSNFSKRTFTVNDQIKIINDFLNFIALRMRECDVWKKATDPEFDNAMEGMEKLVMNRLYDFTFTPQLPKTIPPRPVLTDDLERDRVLSQRIALFGWIEEKHLDIRDGEGSKGFLLFAQQELVKINHYKAPRDKVICILNSCKVIFGLIRHLKMDEGADAFLPILIFVVLKSNPENLLSNVEFIGRFRNPAKLQSEAGYYLSSLTGAVSFIETMDHSSLSNITQEEFERNVEHSIQSMTQPNSPVITLSRPTTPSRSSPLSGNATTDHPSPPVPRTPHAGEESAQPLALPSPSAAQSLTDDARRIFQKTGDTISKPISAIGKIFSDALDGAEAKLNHIPGPFSSPSQSQSESEKQSYQQQQPQQPWMFTSGPSSVVSSSSGYPQTPMNPASGAPYNTPPIQTPYKPRVRKATPSRTGSPAGSLYDQSPEATPTRPPPSALQHQPSLGLGRPGSGVSSHHVSRTPTPSLDLEAVQAEINQATDHAVTAARETLRQMFPTTEEDVINLVLEANDNDLGKSIDKLLEMS